VTPLFQLAAAGWVLEVRRRSEAVPPAPQPAGVEASGHRLDTIQSPLSGDFWPAVRPGQALRVGDVIGRIHADDAVHEIETRLAGRVVRLLVEPGTTVSYGSELLAVDPFEQKVT
jgi:biotin carboxyl carrier protein